MAVYARNPAVNPAVRSISAVSPDRRVDPVPWTKQPVLTPSYKGPAVQDPMEFMKPSHPHNPHARAHSPPPRVTYALCADPRQGALSPIPQRNSHVPTPMNAHHMQNVEKPNPQIPQVPYQVAFDEAMTARPGMGRRLEWHGLDAVSPMHGAGIANEAGPMPYASPMPKYRERRESAKPQTQVPVEDTIIHPQSPQMVKRGNSDSSLPEKPSSDLQKQIVEEVNRVLENRLAAKEETEALKKELDKAMNDREIEAQQVQHLTERLIEMEQRLEREADARRKIQAKLDQGVLMESELHQKDMKISELERKLKAKSDEARNLKVRQERMEKQMDDTRATREKTQRDCQREVQERLQEKRDVEEKLFTAQTRSKSLEQRCQELEETLKQERNNEQLLRMEKDLEQRESLLKGRQQELQARLLEADRNREELQRVRDEMQMQKQQLQIEVAEFQQQQDALKTHAKECDQKYRNWESQRQEVEQQNERTAQELNIMVQQSQEKVMEEVKKRASLEKDMRESLEEKTRLQIELQKQKDELATLQSQLGNLEGFATPAEMKEEMCSFEMEIGQQNAELMHGINCLSQELKWLASCNGVLREHIPSDLEPKVKAALENMSSCEWQPPSDMAQWLRERLNSLAHASSLGGA